MSAAPGERFALYYAPESETPLGRFGRRWLGYDAATGERVAQPELAEVTPARLAEITAEPRHYGFHATLKPPFALAPGRSRDELAGRIASFAGAQRPFAAPPLTLATISGFWALTLGGPSPDMADLAAASVEEFDDFRAPPAEAELRKRRSAGLLPAQDAYLARWGYPYVFDEFRFHMTLSGRLAAPEGEVLRAALEPLVAPLCREAIGIDAICLFHQESRSAPFRLLRRYRFGRR